MDMNLHSSHHETTDARDTFEVVGGYKASDAVATRKPKPIVAGAGWYHEAAIEEAARAAIDARCNPHR